MNIHVVHTLKEQPINVIVNGVCNHAEADTQLTEFVVGESKVIVTNVLVCPCGMYVDPYSLINDDWKKL